LGTPILESDAPSCQFLGSAVPEAEARTRFRARGVNPAADRVGGVARATPVDSFTPSEPQSDGGLTLIVASGEVQLFAVGRGVGPDTWKKEVTTRG
jgi:hypothetical protein